MTTDVEDIELQTAAEIAMDDCPRQARRREVRKQIAKRNEVAKLVVIEQERIRALDSENDAAVNEHQSTCAPIQVALSNIEDQIVSATADRLPIPDGIESRRRELIEELHVANEKLSDAVERTKRLRAPIAKKIDQLRTEVAQGAILENKLAGHELGNPRLLLDSFCSQQAAEWAGARLHAAQKQVAKWREQVALAKKRNEPGNEELYAGRMARWSAEECAAADAMHQASAASDAAHRALVEE